MSPSQCGVRAQRSSRDNHETAHKISFEQLQSCGTYRPEVFTKRSKTTTSKMISRLVFLQAVFLCTLNLSAAVNPEKTLRGATNEETDGGAAAEAKRSLRMGKHFDK